MTRPNYFDGFSFIPAGTELLCPVCSRPNARLNVDLDLKNGNSFDVRAVSHYDSDSPFGIGCCGERYMDFDGRIFTEYGWI